MTKNDNLIWKTIQTICWFIFAGYCVQTGALFFNYTYSLFKPIAIYNLHLGLNLSDVYQKSMIAYTIIFMLIIAISAFKSYLFFLTLKLFKKLNLSNPFSSQVQNNIAKITYLTFFIGVVCTIALQVFKKLVLKGYDIGVVERYVNDGEAYLVMAAILYVIVLIFKRGIELQNENDLTV